PALRRDARRDLLPDRARRGHEHVRAPERKRHGGRVVRAPRDPAGARPDPIDRDRKSTRLNSSHVAISYAVFCLKKKKIKRIHQANMTTVIRVAHAGGVAPEPLYFYTALLDNGSSPMSELVILDHFIVRDIDRLQ